MSLSINRSALLPFSAAQMYDLVCDIQSYPQFLKWCESSVILERSVDHVLAELKVSYARLDLSFSTNNTLIENKSVCMALHKGPFKNMSGQWKFESLTEQACRVSLQMDFAFANPVSQKLVGKVFQSLINEQLSSFERRAHQIYSS